MISLEDAKKSFDNVIKQKHGQTLIHIKAESNKYEQALVLGKEKQNPSREAPEDDLVL